MKTIPKTFSFQGHRGCRGLFPENTIPGMIEALKLGVNTLEMDAVVSQDSQIIVSHDPFFNHEITLTPSNDTILENQEKKFNIYKMTYNEIKDFDVGSKPHPRFADQKKIKVSKPLLCNLIDSTENFIYNNNLKNIYYNIETKCLPSTDNIFHPNPEIFSDLLMNVVINKKIEKRTIIQSFDPRTLRYIHKKYPNQKTALLIEDDDHRNLQWQLNNLGFNPSIYSPHFSLVTRELIDECHRLNIQVIPWTINDIKEMRRLINLGVDGLISDFPNLYKHI